MGLVRIIKCIIHSTLISVDKCVYSIFSATTSIDKSLVIFEGMMGRYDESSWVLYHYLQKKGKYKFVWMVRDPKKYISTVDTKFISRYHYTFNVVADYYYAKAGYSFYTHTTSPTRYTRPGQKKIFIGHGYAIKGGKNNGRDSYNNFDYALAMGLGAIETQALFVGCKVSDLLPLGLPRNDLLIRNSGVGKDNPFVRGKGFRKVFIWMPTFRETKSAILSEMSCATDTGLPLFETEDSVDGLNSYLTKLNCSIILKIHRLQLQKEVFKKKYSNIIIITDNDVAAIGKQLYQLVGYSDALLTDYSSISVDYLLLDKPIGYILSDMDYYKKDRGFTSANPLDMMAGSYIYSTEDCYDFINSIVDNIDNSKEKRKDLLKKLHAAPNGNSCELIERQIMS